MTYDKLQISFLPFSFPPSFCLFIENSFAWLLFFVVMHNLDTCVENQKLNQWKSIIRMTEIDWLLASFSLNTIVVAKKQICINRKPASLSSSPFKPRQSCFKHRFQKLFDVNKVFSLQSRGFVLQKPSNYNSIYMARISH